MATTEKPQDALMKNYGDRLATLVRGKGCWVWDETGRKYLDLLSGIAVNLLGHCHPAVVEAIRAQSETLIHVSNLYHAPPQAMLAAKLAEISFGGRVFFGNSGAEANEAAIKLARRYMRAVKGEDRYAVITMENSFHGRTLATVTATGQKKYHQHFQPLVEGFAYAKFNDLQSVEALVDEKTAAVLVEPIQGEGGDNIARADFLRGLRTLCDERGLLLIYDEVQCGMGRTGRWFAYQHAGVEPDVMTLAKPLGGGLPLGACLARPEVAEALVPGSHASTFGGNPVSCAAGLAMIDYIEREDLLPRVMQLGALLSGLLDELAESCDCVVEERGVGLMRGIELDRPGKDIVTRCQEKGLLINCTAERFVRFLPPLTVTEEELRRGVQMLGEAIAEVAS